MPSDNAAGPIEGRLSGGESAQSLAVTVAFEADGLAIHDLNGQRLAFWPFGTLSAAGPIRLDDADALLRNTEAPRSTLFLKAPSIGERIINAAPHLAARRERLRHFHRGLIVALGFGGIVAFLLFSKISYSKYIAELIPHKAASNVGRQSVRSFANFSQRCTDKAGLAALNKIVTKLASVSGEKHPFELHVIKLRIPNAFALPGKHIIITSRLIEDAGSADEVAGVLAHEIGHGIEKDAEALFVRSLGMQALIQLFTGQSGDGTGLTFGALLLQLRYTRDAERKADAHALALLQKARIPAKPVAEFFLRNKQVDFSEEGTLQYLSTHPVSATRAKLFQSSPDIGTSPALSEKEWAEARVVCGPIVPRKPKLPPEPVSP